MARGYSRDLRERLLQAVASGLSVVEVARRTGVSESTIGRYQRKAAARESLEPGTSPGGPRKITGDEEAALRAQVAAISMPRWPSTVPRGRRVGMRWSAAPR